MCVQADLHASSSNVSRLPDERLVPNVTQCRAVSMDVGHESVADAQSCVQGIQLMKLEHSDMEVSHHANMSAHSATPVNLGPVKADVVAEELNATMNHVIDVAAYPFTSQPDNDQLNASIMIDPSNPFDEEMIESLLSKLAQPLTSHENYHRVNANIPKIFARGSIQLGMFCIVFYKSTFCCFV